MREMLDLGNKSPFSSPLLVRYRKMQHRIKRDVILMRQATDDEGGDGESFDTPLCWILHIVVYFAIRQQ